MFMTLPEMIFILNTLCQMLIFGKGEVLVTSPFCRMLYSERNTSHERTLKKKKKKKKLSQTK